MKVTQAMLDVLENKFVSSLPGCLNDPDVLNYNFYNNASGVGVKVTRKKMTIEDLALIVMQGFADQKIFNDKQELFNQRVETFMTEQKVFNEEVKTFMTEQKVFNSKQEEFNAKQIAFNEEIIKRLDRIENCPTVKKEILEGQTTI